MASPSAQDPPIDNEYDEDEDEDFNPETAAAVDEASASSDSEDDTTTTIPTAKRKRTKTSDQAEDVDFENSGDEATIQSGKRKKRKSKDIAAEDDEQGGEGGLIKTRAQRKLEQKEKKALATSRGASVDVNALWAQMASGPKPADELRETDTSTAGEASKMITETPPKASAAPSLQAQEAEPTVLIKRTYDFAGQTMTEEKRVFASSAEAKLYLAELERQKEAASNTSSTSTNGPSSTKPPLRRPKKRASMFGNNFNSEAQGTKKLTTLEKSKLDWAQHVDQHGISEELDEHSKAKDTYLGRMDFLGRMEAKREDEARERRTKG